jgi:hypothetical protein
MPPKKTSADHPADDSDKLNAILEQLGNLNRRMSSSRNTWLTTPPKSSLFSAT